MFQQHFQFARRGNQNVMPQNGERRTAEGNGFQTDQRTSKPVQLLNPGELASPDNTMLLRLSAPCQELGLSVGDLVLVDNSAANKSNPLGYWAVKNQFDGVYLVQDGELGGESTAELIGGLVLALPGAKGLRYIANLYPIGREIKRRRAG